MKMEKNQMQKTNNKYLPMFLLALFGMLFVLPFTLAAVAWVTPVANANLTTSVVVNVTYANITDVTTPVSANSSFYWNGSGSWVSVSKTGFACTAAFCNATLTLTGLTDLKGGSLNVTLGNNTLVLGGTNRVVTVDNTAPTGTKIGRASCRERV